MLVWPESLESPPQVTARAPDWILPLPAESLIELPNQIPISRDDLWPWVSQELKRTQHDFQITARGMFGLGREGEIIFAL